MANGLPNMGKKKTVWHTDALNAVRTLRSGGVLLHATDTVWGLAADATSAEAVGRIFDIKSRNRDETLLMLVDSEGELEHLLPHLPEAAWELLDVSDRPVTLVGSLNRNCRHTFAPGMVRADGSIAVRLVNDPYLSFMIAGLGKPLASTSANLAKQPTPRTFDEVDARIVHAVDYAGTHKRSELNSDQASMMVHFDDERRMRILRS